MTTSILCQPAPLCVSNKYCSFFCAFAASSSTTLPPHSLLLNDFYFDFFLPFSDAAFFTIRLWLLPLDVGIFIFLPRPSSSSCWIFRLLVRGLLLLLRWGLLCGFFFACCSLDMCFFSLRFVFFHIHLFLPCSVSAIPLWVVSFFCFDFSDVCLWCFSVGFLKHCCSSILNDCSFFSLSNF